MLLHKLFPIPMTRNNVPLYLFFLDTARSQEKEGKILRLCNQVELPFSGRPIFSRQIVGI